MMISLFLINTFFSSFTWAAIGLSVAAILGFFIAKLSIKPLEVKEVIETQADTSDLEKELDQLRKKLQQADKNIDSLKKDKSRWETKFNEKSEAYEALLIEFKEAKIEMEQKLSDYNAMEKRKDQIEAKYSNFKKEYDLIKQELPNERNEKNSWKNKAQRKDKELVDFRNKILAEQKRVAQLQAKLKELEDIQEKLDSLRIDYKVQSRKVKKLISDCEYWEKQHYDTNHELTAQREKYEELLDLNQERHLQILRMREEKKSHLEMIADYKGKFVKLHDEVHKNK